MKQYEPNRETVQFLRYKNWEELQVFASQNGGRQHHGRYLRTWRWEKPLYKFFEGNGNWEEAAQNLEAWEASVDEMVYWRNRHR